MRTLTVILLATSAAAAAPPPRETQPEIFHRHWGEIVDPDRDCKFVRNASGLKVHIPASEHSYSFGTNTRSHNAPRVVRHLDGDFSLQVKLNKSAPHPETSLYSLAGAGLYLWNDSGFFATIQRFHTLTEDVNRVPSRTVHYRFDVRKPLVYCYAQTGIKLPIDESERPVFLRLCRVGFTVKTSTSLDGEKWVDFKQTDGQFPAKLTVGILVEHTGDRPYETEFEDLKLTLQYKR